MRRHASKAAPDLPDEPDELAALVLGDRAIQRIMAVALAAATGEVIHREDPRVIDLLESLDQLSSSMRALPPPHAFRPAWGGGMSRWCEVEAS